MLSHITLCMCRSGGLLPALEPVRAYTGRRITNISLFDSKLGMFKYIFMISKACKMDECLVDLDSALNDALNSSIYYTELLLYYLF